MYWLALYRKVYRLLLSGVLGSTPLCLRVLLTCFAFSRVHREDWVFCTAVQARQDQGAADRRALSTNFPVPHLLLCFCKKEAKPQLNVSLSLSPIVFGGIGCGCVLSFYPLALGLVSHQRLMYHFQPTDVPSKSPIFFPWKPFYFVCGGGLSLHKWFSERFLCPQCHFTRTC